MLNVGACTGRLNVGFMMSLSPMLKSKSRKKQYTSPAAGKLQTSAWQPLLSWMFVFKKQTFHFFTVLRMQRDGSSLWHSQIRLRPCKILGYISMVGAQTLTKTATKGIVGQTTYTIPAGGVTAFLLTDPVRTKEDMTRLFLTLTTDVSRLVPNTSLAMPHGLIDPAGLLELPLFSAIKAAGADANATRENARKLGMGLMMAFTCSQIALNQVTIDDLSRLNAHTAYLWFGLCRTCSWRQRCCRNSGSSLRCHDFDVILGAFIDVEWKGVSQKRVWCFFKHDWRSESQMYDWRQAEDSSGCWRTLPRSFFIKRTPGDLRDKSRASRALDRDHHWRSGKALVTPYSSPDWRCEDEAPSQKPRGVPVDTSSGFCIYLQSTPALKKRTAMLRWSPEISQVMSVACELKTLKRKWLLSVRFDGSHLLFHDQWQSVAVERLPSACNVYLFSIHDQWK